MSFLLGWGDSTLSFRAQQFYWDLCRTEGNMTNTVEELVWLGREQKGKPWQIPCSTFLEAKGGGGSKKALFPFITKRRAPSKKHPCFLEGAAWNFSWLAPPWPTSYWRETRAWILGKLGGRDSTGRCWGHFVLMGTSWPLSRTVSEYSSAHVSCVGLKTTKQAREPYSDNLLNRTRNPSEPYSDKESPFRRALRRLLC